MNFGTRPSGRNQRRNKVILTIGIFLVAIVLFAIAATFVSGKKETEVHSAADEPLVQTDRETEIEAVLSKYRNLGIVSVEGYLNIHDKDEQKSDVVGKLYDKSACEILHRTDNGWLHIESGGIEGYVHPDYVKTGEEAREIAKNEIKERAIIEADRLRVRAAPSTEADTVFTALKNERYVVEDDKDGWIRLKRGWISGKYARIELSLNEARTLDVHETVLNMYDNLGISEVSHYLNIREKPGENEKIIGKLTSKAGCDIQNDEGDWLKIRSGDITGYVKASYILQGQKAKEEAIRHASLMAIVKTDDGVLNVRTEPNENAKVWTQITNSERYPVLEQMDGWVKIELEEDDSCYVKSEFVDVRYALNEAIRFSPEETAEMESLSTRRQIVNYAMQFLGNRYIWGGTSLTNGCDCSGFTMRVMERYGVSLPHYSGSQAQMGEKVSASEIRPGDLVFYANSGGRINHVGIYIGNGQLIHAASRRSGIKISNWTYRSPKAIRNVLGD